MNNNCCQRQVFDTLEGFIPGELTMTLRNFGCCSRGHPCMLLWCVLRLWSNWQVIEQAGLIRYLCSCICLAINEWTWFPLLLWPHRSLMHLWLFSMELLSIMTISASHTFENQKTSYYHCISLLSSPNISQNHHQFCRNRRRLVFHRHGRFPKHDF